MTATLDTTGTGIPGFLMGATSSVVTETFAINGTAEVDSSIQNNDVHGRGIESKGTAAPNFEIFLNSISGTGSDQVFTDLHLDWQNENNPESFLGKSFNSAENATFFNALMTSNDVPLTLTSAGNITTTDSIVGGTYTFTGATNTNFDLGSNFVGGIAPGYTLYPNEVVSIVSGTAAISSPALDNNGTIIVTGTGSTLDSTASVSGTGQIDISSGGHVTLGSTSPVTNTISFGSGGTSTHPNLLDLNSPGSGVSQFGTIENFGTFDTIIVSGFGLPNGSNIAYDYDDGELSVSPAGGGESEQFILSGPNGNLTNASAQRRTARRKASSPSTTFRAKAW
jgi:hypothetical protein